MLNTALGDSERTETCSRFPHPSNFGRVEWHLESLSLEECIELALCRIPSVPQLQVSPATFSQSRWRLAG